MKRLSLIALVAAFVVSAFAFLASSAFAIPVFARKYNTQCNMCHLVPPRLNKFGVAFKENGFELPPGTVLPESEVFGNQVLSNDEPKAIVGAGFPFMIRTGLIVDLTGNTTAGGATTGNNAFLGAALGEFGVIGGGAVETPFGGLGFWIDAPSAVIGAIDFDFNFNPMFKLAVGTDGPKVGYALALTPNYLGGRNPATQQTTGATAFVWGNGGQPALEVRGTTNPSTGLGLNYAVGMLIPGAVLLAPNTNAPGGFYGHVSYFIDAINSNIGVGISSENNGVAGNSAGSQMLVDFAYGVGDNLLLTSTYNKVTLPAAAGVTAGTSTMWATQVEYTVSPTLTVGGRYTDTPGAAAGVRGNIMSIGANYKLLQNVQAWANYSATNNNGAGIAAATTSLGQAGIDFVF